MQYNKSDRYISKNTAILSCSNSSSSVIPESVNPACWCVTSITISQQLFTTQSV